MTTLRTLVITGLCLICLCDFCAILVIFLANPKYIMVGSYR